MKLAALVLAFTLTAAPALAAPAQPASAPAASKWAHVALPDDVAPLRYAVRIRTDAPKLTFSGQARVEVAVKRPTRRIEINAADIAFQRVALSGRAEAPRVVFDKAQQTADFVFSQPVAPGRYTLSFDYTGVIYQQASGLFALDYPTDTGQKRALFTQFENSDARRFIPGWDEPGVKTVYALTVEAPAGEMAVSNMPAAETKTLANGLQEVRFQDTPKMSAYLLFFGLGDFERVHRMVGKTDVGVIVRRGMTSQAQFALDAASEILPYYNDYFGTPYPLPKLDLVAGPGRSQFFAAMENWGAIYYFDYALLVDPQTTTESDKQNIYVDIAHEMAHQWFGDLVTMAWWDDLWLNEGFASWMENKATDHFHPEWKIWLKTKAGEQAAMRIDAKAGTHPVITPIKDVFAAADAFDGITYEKGHSVIHMLETYVGEDVFRAGVRNYIAHHAYGNTVTDDLWREVDAVSPRKITGIAHDFTLQAGAPLISAGQGAKGGVRVTQSRFGVDEVSKAARTWRTPVVAHAGATPWRGLVSAKTPASLPGGAAVLLNAGQTGYFRSAYSQPLWTKLMGGFGALAPVDQLGLIYDSRALSEAGYAPLPDFLALTLKAQDGQDPVVVEALASQLSGLDDLYDGQAGQERFRAFARGRLTPAFTRYGWDAKPGEPDNAAVTRRTLLTTLAKLNDPAVLAEAKRRFEGLVKDPASLKGAARQAVLSITASHADAATWDQLRQMAKTSANVTDRTRLYRLLGASHDPALADKTLALALSGDVSPTDAPELISGVAAVFPDKAYDFVMANRAKVETLIEPTSRTTFFTDLASRSHDPAMLGKLKTLEATIPASSKGEVAKAGASIRYRIAAVKRLPEADRWIAAHPS
jgi:aminopeptidase N